MSTFVLIGAAGYVAPKHMQAIKEVDGDLIAAFDPHDSVGVLDSYFPQSSFFTEFERFDRFCNKIQHGKMGRIDYVVVCSPNYLHDSHCRWGLRLGSDVICEKPVVCHERNLDELSIIEAESGQRVWCISQLWHSPVVKELKEKFSRQTPTNEIRKVNVQYHTPRGEWYLYSWKGDKLKSGGIATNIGIHLFDVAASIFGGMINTPTLNVDTPQENAGYVPLKRAALSWDLSIKQKIPIRRFEVNGENYELTRDFYKLHVTSYQEIIAGRGIALEDVRPAIQIVEAIRDAIN